MTRFLAALLLLALAPTAHADDEGSEQTAVLVGDNADTMGVIVHFNAIDGWTMEARAKPGATPVKTTLALPKDHGHYLAYVAPGRTAIAFIALSIGHAPTDKDMLGWAYAPDGKLLRSWTYGVLASSELDPTRTRRSVSHWDWAGDTWKQTSEGLTFEVRASKRVVTLSSDATTLK
jgi:hypothetical protein